MSIAIGVNAYGTNNPVAFGHTAGEIEGLEAMVDFIKFDGPLVEKIFTVPDGISRIRVRLYGGGGGGAQGDSSGTEYWGAGGGGAAYVESLIDVTEGDTVYFNLGAGGASISGCRQNGGQGKNGQDSTFTYGEVNLVAGGGKGGNTIYSGGDGGVASGGDINSDGEKGQGTLRGGYDGWPGGDSGSGGRALEGGQFGERDLGPGAGGAGSGHNNCLSGAGGDGKIIMHFMI